MKKIIIVILALFFTIYAFSITKDVYFENMDIKDALMQLGTLYNTSIIFPENLNGKVTVELYNVSIETALNVILSNFNYTFEKINDVYFIITDQSILYYKSHTYTPKFRSPEELSKLIPFKNYIVGNNIIVYCPDDLWNNYKNFLENIDKDVKNNTIISYAIYYIKNSELKNYNIDTKKLLEALPYTSKFNYILNTFGFFTGNDPKVSINGSIKLNASVNNSEVIFEISTENDSASTKFSAKEGEIRKILEGKFGKFIVITNIKKINYESSSYKIEKLKLSLKNSFNLTYFSNQNLLMSISTENLSIFFDKNASSYLGAKFNPINDFWIGGKINIQKATETNIIFEDKFSINPLYVEFNINKALNLEKMEIGNILSNLYMKMGIGLKYYIDENVFIDISAFYDSLEIISGRLKLFHNNFGAVLYIDQNLNYGGGIYINW
ncbi:STN domain-containing protein [Thermosipho globiformans]|uniref:STN domain-containing protein n=1 Tax=Thermosipho globiformans TaxID=380685 RepID=UPI000F8D7D1E|nr:STN domain-containing protein [Thermosipho globiformans]